MGPLKVIGGILLLLSPLGPIVILNEVILPLWDKLKWLWNNWNTDDILVRAREVLREQILPSVINGVDTVSQAMAAAAAWISNVTTQLSETFGRVLGVIGVSRCLHSVTRIMNLVGDQFRRLAEWAQTGFTGLTDRVRAGLEILISFLRPILDFLVQLSLTIVNPLLIPGLILGSLWRLIPDKLKPPIITFLLELLITFIKAIPAFFTVIGPLGSILKQAVVGFLEGLRGATDKVKTDASNRIAQLIGGGGLEFMAGYSWGILRGIWEGLTDPFVIIFMLVKAAVGLSRYLYNLIQPMISGIIPPGLTKPEVAGVAAVPQPSPSTAAVLREAATTTAGAEQEWETSQAEASSRENANEQGLFSLLSSGWSSILKAAGRIGSSMAKSFLNFLRLPDFDLGNKIGWVAGTVIFEVVLAVLTGGISAVIRVGKTLKPVLQAILRFLDLGGEILGGLMRLLGSIRRPLMNALESIGSFLSNIPGLRSVFDRVANALKAIFRYSDEAASARRGTGEAFEGTTEEAGERAAREAMEETGERVGRETAEEAGEKGAELPIALVAGRRIESANDAIDAPIPILLTQLNVLKRRFRWIDRFEARPKGISGHYSIHMIASDIEVDPDYTPSEEELPEGTQQAIGHREARIQGAHDIGVSLGRARAEQLGLRDANWVNPFEFRRSRFGQGFDDVMQDSSGNLWIVEYKGGASGLAPGQMSRDWVVSRIEGYREEGGRLGRFWAKKLEDALNNGRLRGIALSTPIVGTIPQPTRTIGTWLY